MKYIKIQSLNRINQTFNNVKNALLFFQEPTIVQSTHSHLLAFARLILLPKTFLPHPLIPQQQFQALWDISLSLSLSLIHINTVRWLSSHPRFLEKLLRHSWLSCPDKKDSFFLFNAFCFSTAHIFPLLFVSLLTLVRVETTSSQLHPRPQCTLSVTRSMEESLYFSFYSFKSLLDAKVFIVSCSISNNKRPVLSFYWQAGNSENIFL